MTLVAFLSQSTSIIPQDSQTKTHSDSSRRDLALAPRQPRVAVVGHFQAGGTNAAFRPARLAYSINIALVAPTAPSASLRTEHGTWPETLA